MKGKPFFVRLVPVGHGTFVVTDCVRYVTCLHLFFLSFLFYFHLSKRRFLSTSAPAPDPRPHPPPTRPLAHFRIPNPQRRCRRDLSGARLRDWYLLEKTMTFDDCPDLKKHHKTITPTLQLTNTKGRPLSSDWVKEFRLRRGQDWRSTILRVLHTWRIQRKDPIAKRYELLYEPLAPKEGAGITAPKEAKKKAK